MTERIGGPDNAERQKKYSKEELIALIQDAIDEKFIKFNRETMADYDTDFSGEEPFLINIWSKERGYDFGYIIFHDFLRRVGMNKTFLVTDYTPEGSALLEKAISDGMIERESEPLGLHRLTRWRVIGDPVSHLERLREKYQ